MIRLYLADIDCLSEPDVFSGYLPDISPERRERLAKYRFQKDRSLSLGAGLLMKRACADFGIPGEEQYLREGPFGKPEFLNCPDLFFNLSHSGSLVFLAMGDVPLGCDVEKHREKSLKRVEKLMTPREYADYCTAPEGAKMRHFFRLWTGKESLMKCTGKGFALPLRSFTLLVGADGLRLAEPIDEQNYFFFEYEEKEEYSFTLCAMNYGGEAPGPVWVLL